MLLTSLSILVSCIIKYIVPSPALARVNKEP